MNIIFFDGHCGLCNGFVDFIIRVDTKGKFKFSPLQSDYALKNLSKRDVVDLTSVVVMIDGQTYRKATGVLKALSVLGGIWKLPSVFNILPENLLNAGYNLVAENRYRLFGKRDTCRIPSPDERSRFIF